MAHLSVQHCDRWSAAIVSNDDDKQDCSLCAGTGIGQHGDPDKSQCIACGGRGWHSYADEYDFVLSPEYEADDEDLKAPNE